MIWDGFSIFRINCAIACGKRTYFFCRCRTGEMALCRGLAHNSIRLCLLEFRSSKFEWSKTVSSSEEREWRHDSNKTQTNKLEWWMILKISLRAKAGVPKTLVKQKLRLHSPYFPQNILYNCFWFESVGRWETKHFMGMTRPMNLSFRPVFTALLKLNQKPRKFVSRFLGKGSAFDLTELRKQSNFCL